MALLRSRAALSSALKVHPMVKEHSLIALMRLGSTAETDSGERKKKKEVEKKKKARLLKGEGEKKNLEQNSLYSVFFKLFCATKTSLSLNCRVLRVCVSLSGQLPLSCRFRARALLLFEHLNERSALFAPRRKGRKRKRPMWPQMSVSQA